MRQDRGIAALPRRRARWFARSAAGLLLLGCIGSASLAHAQTPERPVWPYRHLAVGNVAFLHSWQPAVQAGYLFQPGLSRTTVLSDEFGASVVIPVRWYLHTLGSAGVSWADEARDGAAFSGLAQLGIVRLLGDDAPLGVSRLGLAAQATTGPRGIGPVARFEFLHGNAALSAGWMSFQGDRRDGFVLSIDLLRCILNDLGLVPRCDVL